MEKINPNLLKDIVAKPYPKVVLLVEFDNPSERLQKKMAKKARKILEHTAGNVQIETEPFKQEQLWKVRQASSTVISNNEGAAKALPMVEDGVVPPERFREFLEGIYQLCERNHLQAAVWGSAGDGHLHMQPYLDLAQVGDRQRAFRVMDEYYNLVISLGGTTSGGNGDGRIRAPYLEKLYGAEVYALFAKIKQIFDPYGTLNPGVKLNASMESVKQQLRSGFTMDHLYDHMPRS